MSNPKAPQKKRSFLRNRYVITVLAIVAVVVLMVMIGIISSLVGKDEDALPPVESPTTFEQPNPEQYEKPTDLPEAPDEEDGEDAEGSDAGPPVQEKSSDEEAARKAAESNLVEWGKQDSEENPKNRVKRMKKITTDDSTVPEDAPLFIDSWHAGGKEKKGEDHGDEGTTSSTVEIEGMSFDRSNGSSQITYNAILSVTVHEEFMGEKFDREPYDFKVTITMKKQGKDWKTDMIVPAAY